MKEGTTLSADQTLGQLAAAYPAVIPKLFEKDLDFCCGGDRSLAEACAERQLDPSALLMELSGLVGDWRSRDESGLPAWGPDQGSDLIDFILDRFHEGHRRVFPGLRKMMDKVLRAHGDRHRFLADLNLAVLDLIAELEPHMQKEELVLFPLIRFLLGENDHAPGACSGTDPGPPIRMMRLEHDLAGEILARIHALTHEFQLPEGVCASFSSLYTTLARLDREIRLQIHLENNVLFPMVEAWAAGS